MVFLWPLKLPSAPFPLYCLPSGCLPMLGWRRRACGAQLAWPEPVLPPWGSSSLGSPSGCSRTNMQFFWVAREEERDPQGSPGSGRSWPGSSRQDLGVKNVGPRDSQTWNQGSSYSSSLSISFFACKMEIRGVPPWRAWEGSSEHVCDMPRARGYVRIPLRVRATGCGLRLRCAGLIVLQHVGSSWDRIKPVSPALAGRLP